MNVGQLKKVIAKLPDEMKIKFVGFANNYENTFRADVLDAEVVDGGYYEYYGDDHAHSDKPQLEKILVIE